MESESESDYFNHPGHVWPLPRPLGLPGAVLAGETPTNDACISQVIIVGNSQQTVVQLVYQGLADVGFVRTNQVASRAQRFGAQDARVSEASALGSGMGLLVIRHAVSAAVTRLRTLPKGPPPGPPNGQSEYRVSVRVGRARAREGRACFCVRSQC